MLRLSGCLLQVQSTETTVHIVGAIGIILVLLSIGFIAFFVFARHKQNNLVLKQRHMQQEFQQQLLQSQVEVQEHTFEQIGKELHDNVGQLLGSTRMLLGITERSLQQVPATLSSANETLSKAIQEIRTLSKILNKEWLEQFSFQENLQAEIQRINSSGRVSLLYSDGHGPIPLSAELQIILFRIVQEAIQNAIRHAGATEISISVHVEKTFIQLGIDDNGSGMNLDETSRNGVGVLNMKHRTHLLGGTILWQPRKSGSGTSVKIDIPLNQS